MDPTPAAGDGKRGALAVALTEGQSVKEAPARLAIAASAISVTRPVGRIQELRRAAIDALLATTPEPLMPIPRFDHRLLVVPAFVAAIPTGCPRTATSPRARRRPPRVALVMKSLANEFFVTMAEGAKAHQAASRAPTS